MSLEIPFSLPTARKKGNIDIKTNILPIPLTADSGKKLNWILFRGLFLYSSVIIQNKEHTKILWENGCFGDGSFSTYGMKGKLKNKLNEEKVGEKSKKSNKSLVSEVLHLCLEEALFLSYALGTLILTNEDGNEMNIDDMWTSFMMLNPKFPLQYAVYHHFRAKGWVVKPGIKFGGDWVLYPVGPQYYHSQYIVWAQCLWEDNLEEDTSLSDRQSGITDVSAVERLSSHVGKSLMICQVLRPRNLRDSDLENTECLKKFIISEVILHHWTPNIEIPKPNDEFSSSKGSKRPCTNT